MVSSVFIFGSLVILLLCTSPEHRYGKKSYLLNTLSSKIVISNLWRGPFQATSSTRHHGRYHGIFCSSNRWRWQKAAVATEMAASMETMQRQWRQQQQWKRRRQRGWNWDGCGKMLVAAATAKATVVVVAAKWKAVTALAAAATWWQHGGNSG